MNRTSRYIIAAFAAIASLASCSKEPECGQEGSGLLPEGQMRGIAVSFEESTRTVLGTTIDGTYYKYRPAFCPGDRIKVSNSTRSEDCTVTDDGGVLKIFTNLEGALTAVYPASAANVTGTNPIPTAGQFKIPATQSGKFSDANVCTAAIAADGTAAGFVNQTALLRFYVDESIGVQKITITGTANLATTGSNLKVITVDPAGDALISTVTENPDKRICYVAIVPGANTLTFESVTTTQGTVSKTMKSGFNYIQNKIYNAFIPYYITIGTQKWAYCNLGAFLPEEVGRYFPWAGTQGYLYNGTKWVKPDGTDLTGGFTNNNAPYNVGGSDSNYSKYTTALDVLKPEDDAANKNWGENWLVPKREEIHSLYQACGGTGTQTALLTGGSISTSTKGIWWCENYNNETGCLFHDGINGLFFPITGYGDGNNIIDYDTNIHGFYWSGTLWESDHPERIHALSFNKTLVNSKANATWRRYGFPIRAVYNEGSGVINDVYENAGSY